MVRTRSCHAAQSTTRARELAQINARVAVLKVSLVFLTFFLQKFIQLVQRFYIKEPYHNSLFSGAAWVQKLLSGHRNRIKDVLGVRKHVFLGLQDELLRLGFSDSCHITLEEQLAIFLWAYRTGVKTRQLAECFQHSLATVSKYVTCSLSHETDR